MANLYLQLYRIRTFILIYRALLKKWICIILMGLTEHNNATINSLEDSEKGNIVHNIVLLTNDTSIMMEKYVQSLPQINSNYGNKFLK